MRARKGHVYLVGAGPGDPDLITVKASRILRNAKIVVYDHLISNALLKLIPKRAEKIFVGKHSGWHILAQDEINKILIEKANIGNDIVRLKGGDPFLFGRGGEEAQALRRAGIKFTIVSGVTSAIAVPSYAGIPLTHRDYASSVAIITGHECISKRRSINWKKLATTVDTIVVLMGTMRIKQITQELIKGGRARDTEVAVIEWGTTAKQRTITGTLSNIARKTTLHHMNPPTIIIIGDVVKLRQTLNWFRK